MCLNYGCGDYNNDQGSDANITLDDLNQASGATGQSLHETIDHMERALDDIEAQKLGVGGGGQMGSSAQA
jgi:hypothetical protein